MNEMTKFGTSQSVLRREDLRFLTGHGHYLDDTAPMGALACVFFRSPIAHAIIASLDVDAAREAPGVRLVLTAADLEGHVENKVAFGTVQNADGTSGAKPRRPILAEDRVRYAGEIVAVVVADSTVAGLDALDLIECDFDELPIHVETAPGGETIHPEAPGNVGYDWAHGDAAAVDAAFADAAHTTRLELIDNRVISNAMEPRGCIANWDGARLHVGFSGQGVWELRDELAKRLKLDRKAVHVTTPDVGGGFGTKAFNYPEYFAVAEAARRLGRPVQWKSTRGEAMLSDVGGRDHVTVAEAAFDSEYRLQALRIDCVSNLGAYNAPNGQYIASDLALKVMPGVYDVQKTRFIVKGVYTNTTPIDAYRGAGRPEAIYVIERLMDWSARQLGQDPIAFRRLSFIPPDAFPYTSAAGETYDVGDFDRVLDRALIEADIAGFPARRADSASRGLLRGLGLCYYIESILGDTREDTRLEFAEDGMVNLHVGTQSNGQGHETVYTQFLTQRAGIPFERIRIVQGDSDLIRRGGGTGGSRSVTMQGNSINKAADEVIAKFRPLAGDELEVADADLVWEDGAFRIAGTDRAVTLIDLAETARSRRPHRPAGHREHLQPACAVLPQRRAFRRGRDRTGDGRYPGREILRRRRFRLSGEPDARRGPGPWWRRPGHRSGRHRARGLFRGRPASVGLVHGLRHAARRRRALHGLRHRIGALDRQRDRHEGLRRGRHRRCPRRRDQRGPRRALGSRRAADRHAPDTAAGLDSDPVRDRPRGRLIGPRPGGQSRPSGIFCSEARFARRK